SAALTRRSQAPTEATRADLADLDLRFTRDLVRLLNEEDANVPPAVADAGDELAAAIDAIVERMRRGGRLVYVGAGTSGALAALDASELPTTFGSPPGEVVAVAAAKRPPLQITRWLSWSARRSSPARPGSRAAPRRSSSSTRSRR